MYVSTPVSKRFMCKIYETHWTEYKHFESVSYKKKQNKSKSKLGYFEFLKIVKIVGNII